MNKYDPNKHHRRSIRLQGYDYSRAGLYFITICCQNRTCFFGEITNQQMNLNEAGQMVEKWYYELENKFPDIRCHEMIVMPNHFHCIVEITVGTDLRVCPYNGTGVRPDNNTGVRPDNNTDICPDVTDISNNVSDIGSDKVSGFGEYGNRLGERNNILGEHVGSQGEHIGSPQPVGSPQQQGEHIGSPQPVGSIPQVVQWFKTMTTNEYIRGVKTLGWKPFDGKLWQRNYYEHIIRNQQSYQRISEYIKNNPNKWKNDTFYDK